MPRRMLVLAMIAVTALAAAAPADAQFPSPRGILGAVSRPFRGLFGHFHHRLARHHEATREASPEYQARTAEQRPADAEKASALNARETPLDPRNPYASAVAYAFWPAEYGSDFGRYGFGIITTAVIGPGDAVAQRRQIATTGSSLGAANSATADALPACDISDTATSDWVAGRMKRNLRADATQVRAFDQVRSQLIVGSRAIRSRCRATNSDSPLERLAELKQRIWAIHDADVTARPAITAFYDTLPDQQKAEFKAPAQPQPQLKAANAPPMGERYKACAAQSGGGTQALLEVIDKKVRPTDAQRSALENLRETLSQMEKLLLASCAQPIADTPTARLDAADNQLVALNYAATNVEIALNYLYASLSDDQKANFDSLGR